MSGSHTNAASVTWAASPPVGSLHAIWRSSSSTSGQLATIIARTRGSTPRPGLVCIPMTSVQSLLWISDALGLLPGGDHPLGTGEEFAAGTGEADAVGLAIEERHVELSFQRPDLLGQSRLAHVQPLGGAREAQLARDRREVAEVAHVDVHSHRLYQWVLDGRPRCQAPWVRITCEPSSTTPLRRTACASGRPPTPRRSPAQVLVRVQATSLNFGEVAFLADHVAARRRRRLGRRRHRDRGGA